MADTLDIPGLQAKSQTASSDLANLQTSIPGLLSSLRSSLTSIYAKDNPLIKARDEALATFMSQPDVSRAELLPQNLPSVAGSPLTLSPTQQNAIVSTRQSAALAPLLGLNQAVSQGYGNIADIVANAGNIYGSQVQAATTNLAQAVRDYDNAIKQQQFEQELTEKKRQFDVEQTRKGQEGIDLASILKAIVASQNQSTTAPASTEWEVVPEDNSIPFGGSQPRLLSNNVLTPGGVSIPSVSGPLNFSAPSTGLNLGNIPINLGLNPSGSGLFLAGQTNSPFALR